MGLAQCWRRTAFSKDTFGTTPLGKLHTILI